MSNSSEEGIWRNTRPVAIGLVLLVVVIAGSTIHSITTWYSLQQTLDKLHTGYQQHEQQMQVTRQLTEAYHRDTPVEGSPPSDPLSHRPAPLSQLLDNAERLFPQAPERQIIARLKALMGSSDHAAVVTALNQLDSALLHRLHGDSQLIGKMRHDSQVLRYDISFSVLLLGLLLILLFSLRRRVRDTQRHLDRHADELVQSEQRFRNVLATAADAIIIANSRGIIQVVNLAAEKMFGYTAEQMQGQNLALLMEEEYGNQHDHYINHYLQTNQPTAMGMTKRDSLFGRRHDGTIFPIEVRLSEAETPYGTLFTGLIRDVTEKRRAEQLLKRQSEDLRVLNQIAAYRTSSLNERLSYALHRALEQLGLQIGIISKIDGERYEVQYFSAPLDSGLYQGQLFELGQTYCLLTMKANNVVAIDHMKESEYAGHPCYKAFALESYIGVPFEVAGEVYGTLNFSSSSPNPTPFSDSDREFVRLLAAWVGGTLESEAAGEQLRVSEHRLHRSQTFANIGTWDWDIQSGALFWSDRVAPLFGYPQGDLDTTYENFLNAVHPEDRQAVGDAVRECVERGKEYNLEHRVVWPDGSIHWVSEKGDVVRSSDGTPLNMLGVVQDITKRKQAEIDLKDSQTRLEQAQQLAHLGHWEANIHSGELFWSEEIYRIFGVDPKQFTPSVEAFHAAVHPDDVALVAASEQSAQEDGRLDVIHRIIRPDGEVRYVHELASLEIDPVDKHPRMRGTVQDITELKQTEAALSESEEKFRGFFELSPVGIALNDIDGHFLEVNEALLNFTGYSREEFMQLSYWQLTPERYFKQEEEQILNLKTHGHYGPYEKEYLHKSGYPLPVLLEGKLIVDQAGNQRIWSLVQDITERKAAESTLLRAKEEAESASRAKSEFLSSMSHELRTPLNAILGFGQLLEIDEGLNEEQIDSVQEIIQAGNHLLELINEVLDLARIESGRIDLSIEGIDLNEILSESLSLIQPLASRREIEMSADPYRSDRLVRADRTRLKQVLVNLLSNAVKYNNHGGKVHIELHSDDENLRITIRDTGPGIAPERIAELFQPFNRLGAESGEIEGTGIGLVISKRLTELMGGKIGMQSELGVGSAFWIEIPEQQATLLTSELSDVISEQADEKRQRRSYRLLYIEDNPANLKLVSHILAHQEHISLHTAHNAELGLELAEARHPDLLLLDINMPGMDGYQLLNILKQRTWAKDLPVIVITANAMPSDMARADASGISHYLTKPLDIPRFLATIEQCLNEADQNKPEERS